MKGKRFSADAFVLLGLLLLLAFLSTRIAGSGQNNAPEKGRPRRTVTSTRPGGWKAAYLLLQRRGIPVRRCEQEPKDWPKDARVVVSGEEYFALGGNGMGASFWDDGQVQTALKWVENGGTLVLMTANGNALTEKLELEVQDHLHEDARLKPLQPAPYLFGVAEIEVPGTNRWTKKPAGALTLFGDDKPAVVALARGKGRIIAVSTAALIDNADLASANNARFLVSLVTNFNTAPTGRVYFDEYHQGYQDTTSFWTAVGQPGQLAFYQLIAVLLLICYSAGTRFGLPRPLPPSTRVSSEYVASLANLYRRARASDAALEGVYLAFWRDLCRAVGLPLDTPTPEVARRAVTTLGDAAMTTGAAAARKNLEQRLDALLHTCESKIDGGPRQRPKDRELLSLARELEEMRKELGLGRDDDRAGR